MKRDQDRFNLTKEMKSKVDELREMEESSFCALLMEIRQQSVLLRELISLMKDNPTNNPLNSRIIERIVEVEGNITDKSKQLYNSDVAGFIPEVDTSGLEINTKEAETKTANVDLDDMPEGMK